MQEYFFWTTQHVRLFSLNFSCALIILVLCFRYMQIHTPTVVQGGGGVLMEPLPRVFDMLQYFKTILPLVESL